MNMTELFSPTADTAAVKSKWEPHSLGAVSFFNIFEHIFAPWTCSTGLETGFKPVLF